VTAWRWTCPLCSWRTPWRRSEDALRVERAGHCEGRHKGHQWTAVDLSNAFRSD